MHQTVVINIVGLTDSLIGPWSPNLEAFRSAGRLRTLEPTLPAVTTSVQYSMLTGVAPREHGVVGNGWYNREYAEVHFWKQSNHLVQAEKVWQTARQRDSSFTCANMFWWYNMYASVDYSVTPRPMYKADGRKIPDCYSRPGHLRSMLQAELGRFPLFNFWGPFSSIESSRWIADASRIVHDRYDPTLMLIYLPHLDYGLQKFGPDDEGVQDSVAELDTVVGDLIRHFSRKGARIMIVSEYGIEPVDDAVHINRALREDGSVAVREEEGLELLDAGASDAFAVADHQIAHVYLRDPGSVDRYASLLRDVDGIDIVLDRSQQAEYGIDHERAGDLVCIADHGRWFSYYYWLNDSRAPDFARCVDIHRKPGYDPVELFINPAITLPNAALAWRVMKKKLGLRTLMDVIPLDTSLVRGSHGRIDLPPDRGPLLITQDDASDRPDRLPCTDVREIILEHLFEDG